MTPGQSLALLTRAFPGTRIVGDLVETHINTPCCVCSWMVSLRAPDGRWYHKDCYLLDLKDRP